MNNIKHENKCDFFSVIKQKNIYNKNDIVCFFIESITKTA